MIEHLGIELSEKLAKSLKLASYDGPMYPGIQWEVASKQYYTLEKLGLIEEYIPWNMAHKRRAVATHLGKEWIKEYEKAEKKAKAALKRKEKASA